jgi:assimilatory nitrate reductase catalytic subunit
MKLYEPSGRFTRELLLSPGGFGLGQVPSRERPDATTPMTCGYCSTGCSLNIHLRDGAAVGLTPATEYPVNLGMACPKGWEALSVLSAGDRAVSPLMRNSKGRLEQVDWPTALREFVARIRSIQAIHGPESVAFLGTGQIVSEELALLGALAKFGMGMVHGDGNTRQCMATAVTAYKQSFGFDAPPYTYADFEESDVLIFVGSNLCIAHPILWERVLRNPHRPRIVVVDPRNTETAMQATDHFAIRPKSDLPFFYGLAHILIQENWIDRRFIEECTQDFADFAAFVADFPPERAAQESGIPVDRIWELARMIRDGQSVSFWWTMGVNQSHEGTRTAQSLINLALMTGNIGRPGTGANSITGQCNAMGSRMFSNTSSLFAGRDFENLDDRADVARLLRIDPARIPNCNSWAYSEIVSGILKGKIKGLWVVATNPAHSWINQNQFKDILGRLDFLVVQDMYSLTETAQLAHLFLPAAGWGEKEGTFINSERRIGLVKKVARAPGPALTDFAIFKLIADAWGVGEMFEEWKSPEAVFQILKRLSRGRPCDITGIRDYRHLDEAGGIQWPYPAGARSELQRRLFEDGQFYHADRRARFLFESPRPCTEPATPRFPLTLLTGRGSAAQWHTQTRTGKSDVLNQLSPRNVYVEINPTDARKFRIAQNDVVVVESQRGQVVARAFVTTSVSAGQVFMPMHYPTVNQLTDAVFDPYSRQPAYKACAVRVQRGSQNLFGKDYTDAARP